MCVISYVHSRVRQSEAPKHPGESKWISSKLTAPSATEGRRHLHEFPELGFAGNETARYVREKLTSFGITEMSSALPRLGSLHLSEGDMAPGR